MKTKHKSKTVFVLKSWDGKYFERATGIGPALTDKLDSAHHFETREAAASHPLANHMLCMFSVEEITP